MDSLTGTRRARRNLGARRFAKGARYCNAARPCCLQDSGRESWNRAPARRRSSRDPSSGKMHRGSRSPSASIRLNERLNGRLPFCLLPSRCPVTQQEPAACGDADQGNRGWFRHSPLGLTFLSGRGLGRTVSPSTTLRRCRHTGQDDHSCNHCHIGHDISHSLSPWCSDARACLQVVWVFPDFSPFVIVVALGSPAVSRACLGLHGQCVDKVQC